jgi:hypothetical protein
MTDTSQDSGNVPSRPFRLPHPVVPLAAEVMEAALAYRQAGLSTIPIAPDGSKGPAWSLLPKIQRVPDLPPKHSWKIFQSRLPTEDEIAGWFCIWSPVCGLAVIGGKVSGGLEVVDIDTFDLHRPWAALVQQEAPGLLDRLVLVQTPRPGVHVYFRTESPEGSQKLAQGMSLNADGSPTAKTLIETKGEGGYCLVPPSPTSCHPSGRPYVYLSDRTLTAVPMITAAERKVLLDAGRQFNQIPNIARQSATAAPVRRRQPQGNRPGDHFNARARWEDILTPYGWALVSVDAEGVQYWRRPGKREGTSATVNFGGHDLLHVFSANAAPFEPNQSVTKFQAITLLKHHGDHRVAARSLRAAGYGVPRLGFGRRRENRRRTRPQPSPGRRRK